MVRALIGMGSSPTSCTENATCWQPIHYACAYGHKELLCELVDNFGVDPHVEDSVSCYTACALYLEQVRLCIFGSVQVIQL